MRTAPLSIAALVIGPFAPRRRPLGCKKAGRVPDDGWDAVVEALRDPDIRVRTTIASLLGRLDPVPPSAIPGLAENAAAGDDGLRLAAAVALRAAGPAAPAAPAAVLDDLLRDATLRVRLAAASAVLANNSDPPEAHNAVREALADANPRIRELGHALVEPLGRGRAPALATWKRHAEPRPTERFWRGSNGSWPRRRNPSNPRRQARSPWLNRPSI